MQFKSTKACGFVLLKTKMSTKRTKEPSFVLLENRYHHQTWHQAPNDLPYTDEQFFWMREPAQIPLKAGWNTIRLICPCLFKASNWHAAFIPVKQETGRNISEATGLKFNGI